MSFMAVQASMHALHASAHIAQTGLMSACSMHSSMQTWHIAMQASSIDIIAAGVMPGIRSIARIIVPHMSAQFMHAGPQDIGIPSIIWVEQTVHACSHAAHASMHAITTCMSIDSMPGIAMAPAIRSIIIASISAAFRLLRASVARRGCPPAAMLGLGAARMKPR